MNFFKAIQSISISSAIVIAPIFTQLIVPNQAQASTKTVVEELKNGNELVNMIWSVSGASNYRQTYYGDVGNANNLNKQYRSQTYNVSFNRCIAKWNNDVLTPSGRGWIGFLNYTTNRWQFATREENGVYNCYIRLPNKASERFDYLMRR